MEMEISPSFSVGMCRRKLIKKYESGLFKVQIKPWEQTSHVNIKDIYTVVNIYKRDADGKTMGENKKIILKGSINDIFKTAINGMLPNRIVVFAAAGKGKTTTVAKITHDWAHECQYSPLKDIPLLFVLRLRNVHREASLGQAIQSELLSDVEDLSAPRLEKFIRKNQNLCWVILDGLDEYKGSILAKGNEVRNSIPGVICENDFTDTRVLVTSRPHLEKDFDQLQLFRIYARMEIEGFSKENSREYIGKFFHQNSKGRALGMFLENSDLINELVSTPLFCMMVCYLWREDHLSDVDTQTKLFDNVIIFLWHHLKSKSKPSILTEFWLGRVLRRLGEVALKGLLDDSQKLIFTPRDFRKFPNVINDGCDLGLLSVTNRDGSPLQLGRTRHTSVEFYHKLGQEHCAARYMVIRHQNTSPFLRNIHMSKLDRLLRGKQNHIREYEHLLRFVSGTQSDVCVRVMDLILSTKVLSESERYRILFDCSSESSDPAGAVMSRVSGCIQSGSVVLKSPTIYTAIGMKKLPNVLKEEVTEFIVVSASVSVYYILN